MPAGAEQPAASATRPAVFLDRDGVLVEPVARSRGAPPEAPHDTEQVRLVPGAVAGLRALRDAGWLLVGVSNQPGAAKGETDCATLRAVHRRVVALLAEQELALDDWRYCPHHPDAVVSDLRGPCVCRKPEPGLLLAAADKLAIDLAASWMVGDGAADVAAGRAARVRTILVEHPASAHRQAAAVEPSARAQDLPHAAEIVGSADAPQPLA
jgi:D-glycero-D-manno-heptose 1,7-bisphosphate phosphatase